MVSMGIGSSWTPHTSFLCSPSLSCKKKKSSDCDPFPRKLAYSRIARCGTLAEFFDKRKDLVSCVLTDFHLFWCNITPSLTRSLLLSTHDLKWYYALNKWWRVMRLVTYLHDEVCPRDSPVMVPGCKLSSRLFTLLLPTVKEKNRNVFFFSHFHVISVELYIRWQ